MVCISEVRGAEHVEYAPFFIIYKLKQLCEIKEVYGKEKW